MNPKTFMLIAGEASGDLLAAELVEALRAKVVTEALDTSADVQPLRTALAPRFFGAGGPGMAAAGVELAFDLTPHALIGIADALKNYFKFRRLFNQLLQLALKRQPDAIICVDFSGFNRRFAHAIKRYVRRHLSEFTPWNPKLVQYVSPQVWASRPGRAYQVAEDYDLLLSIFPFEKDWYAKRVPKLRVEFVGHPVLDRFTIDDLRFMNDRAEDASIVNRQSQILLLPGSRTSELKRHLPVISGALKLIRNACPQASAQMVLPNESLAQQAKALGAPTDVELRIGGLPAALAQADAAIASTGTVTMECACFGVPTVTLYKASWTNYLIARAIVKVKSATMPNLLANEEVYPEFIQNAATPANVARATLGLLQNEPRRAQIKKRLAEVVAALGGRGANQRAAEAITGLLR